MKSITFISPKTSWKLERTPYPPLGLGYLAETLRQKNWDVSIIDGQILDPIDYEYRIQNIKDKIVGLTTTLKQIKEAERIANLIKLASPKTIVVVGGPGANVIDPQIVENVDIIMKGEAEESLPRLLYEIQLRGCVEKITGYHKVGSIVLVVCKNPINLDTIPYPARDLFPFEKYLEVWKKNTGITSISIISSRGCPYGCIFCDKNVSGWKFRARSPKNLVDEMEILFQKYQPDDIFFYDDLFVYDYQRVIGICEEILKRKLRISWSAQGRVNRVDAEMVKMMKKAGCSEIYFGVESGSDRILQYLKKGFTRKQVIEAFEMCHRLGVRPGMYLIVGIPGETKEDIEATKDLVKKCRPHLLNFSYLMPFPGTPLFKQTKHWIKHCNYSQWDEMNESVYDYPFEITPKEAHDEIYEVFKNMVKDGMEHSSLQFCCEQ